MKFIAAKTIAMLALVIAAPLAVNAQQLPGKHPGYLVRPEQPEDQPSMRVSSQIGVAQSAGS